MLTDGALKTNKMKRGSGRSEEKRQNEQDGQ